MKDYKFWIWMHTNDRQSPHDWKVRMERIKEAGIDAALINFYTGSIAYYENDHLPFSARMMEMILPIAEDVGIEVHSWSIGLRNNILEFQALHPEWYSVSREGKSSLTDPPYVDYYQWLCPSRPEVVQYVQNVAYDQSLIEGLAGFHIDYIRHPDVYLPVGLQPDYNLVQDREFPEFDFCYDEVCRTAFKKQTGIDPIELDDPSQNEEWALFRQEAVRHVVDEAGIPVQLAGKLYSAAVFPTPSMARKMVRQNWDLWNLDAVFPMIYHNFYNEPIPWIETATREGVSALPDSTPLYTGVYFPGFKPGDVSEVVDRAIAGGAQGVSFFDYGALTDAHFEALKQKIGR